MHRCALSGEAPGKYKFLAVTVEGEINIESGADIGEEVRHGLGFQLGKGPRSGVDFITGVASGAVFYIGKV